MRTADSIFITQSSRERSELRNKKLKIHN